MGYDGIPDAMGNRWLPPSSGVLLGEVMRAFSLDDPDVSGRDNFLEGELVASVLKKDRVLEYFAGARVKPDTENLVLSALAKALVGSCVIPVNDTLRMGASGKQVEAFIPVLCSLTTLAEAWDQVLSGVRSMSASVENRKLAALPFLRLFAIEISLRLMAYLALSEIPPPTELPEWTWARPDGANLLLHKLLKKLDGEMPGPVEIADQLEKVSGHVVSHQAVSRWFASKDESIPADDSLRALAVWLAAKTRCDSGTLLGDLRRHVGLWRLCKSLAVIVGWDAVGEVADRIIGHSSVYWPLMQKFGFKGLEASMRQTLVAGCLRSGTTGGNATLTGHMNDGNINLGPLMTREQDPLWRTELLVVGETGRAFSVGGREAFLYAWNRKWDKFVRRIQACLQRAAGFERVRASIPAAMLASGDEAVLHIFWTYNRFWTQETCALLEFAASQSKQFDADLSEQVASNEQAFGQFDAALSVFEEAVFLAPNDAYKAFRLGALHGEVGNVKQAEHWLNKAASLHAGWLLPRMEIARVHLHVGNPTQALTHLGSLDVAKVRENLFGLVLLREACFRLKHWERACEYARELIVLQKDNAEAYLGLALACRQLADEIKNREKRSGLLKEGREAAKQARALGIEDALGQFEEGRTW